MSGDASPHTDDERYTCERGGEEPCFAACRLQREGRLGVAPKKDKKKKKKKKKRVKGSRARKVKVLISSDEDDDDDDEPHDEEDDDTQAANTETSQDDDDAKYETTPFKEDDTSSTDHLDPQARNMKRRTGAESNGREVGGTKVPYYLSVLL